MAATEMAQVVDEDDEVEKDRQRRQKESEKSIFDQDWDKKFAYKTFKIVRILDRNLGILYWSICTFVIMYVIIVAFNIEGNHAQLDPGIGTVITRFKGKAFSKIGDKVKIYDEVDMRFPVIEPYGAFILTKRVMVKGQKQGQCVDQDNAIHHCTPAEPCPDGLICNVDVCEVKQGWCPSLGDMNAKSPPADAVVEKIHGLEHTWMSISSGIAFPGIGNYFYVTGGSVGATNPFKNITLGGILDQAQYPVDIEDVLETGALIGLSFYWDCDVTTDCEPNVVIKRLDDGQGFVQKRVRHYRVNGVETRDAMYMYGLRILVDSSGIGRRLSLMNIVLQIGSAIALMRTASIAADFMMLRLYGPDRRAAFYKCKVVPTQDYSDLQDRINLIDEQKSMGGNPLMSRGGAEQVPLGLGPGGRGGLASAVMRGRLRA